MASMDDTGAKDVGRLRDPRVHWVVPWGIGEPGHASLSIWVAMGGSVTEMSPASAWATTAASSFESMWDSKLLLGLLLELGQHVELVLLPDSVDPESKGIEPGGDSGDCET